MIINSLYTAYNYTFSDNSISLNQYRIPYMMFLLGMILSSIFYLTDNNAPILKYELIYVETVLAIMAFIVTKLSLLSWKNSTNRQVLYIAIISVNSLAINSFLSLLKTGIGSNNLLNIFAITGGETFCILAMFLFYIMQIKSKFLWKFNCVITSLIVFFSVSRNVMLLIMQYSSDTISDFYVQYFTFAFINIIGAEFLLAAIVFLNIARTILISYRGENLKSIEI